MSIVEIIRRRSAPLSPMATDESPRVEPLEGVAAVVFDVYGTLIISGSGDVGTAAATDRGDALDAALEAVGRGGAFDGVAGVERLMASIEAAHRARRGEGVEFPEIDIRTIWSEVAGHFGVALEDDEVARLAVEYECRVNPVWPMPNLDAALAAVRERGLLLGVVSNAQFFTPALFDALLGRSLEDLGFREELCIWSYRLLEAKPSVALYERLVEALAAHHQLAPQRVLYVGNDMRNDIVPAASVGLRTALFAGDQRSLRLRADDDRCRETEPDRVLTDLGQLARCVS